jgi:glycosyltransferase involved in cell wall biosynthesis
MPIAQVLVNMRIAQVAPLYESVPPRLYGGTERVVSYLTEELVRLGHEVTLFASGDSVTQAKLVAASQRSLWNDPECRDFLAHHARLIGMVFEDVSRFDIIHFHSDYIHYPLLRYLPCRSVTTIHGRLYRHDVKRVYQQFPEVPLVSISNSQRLPAPEANWQATVYHGIPRELHTFRDHPSDYLAFVGRISPQKGVDRAVKIARLAGKKLKVAARIDPTDEEYFRTTIEPLFQANKSLVEFVGQVGDKDKDELLGNAAAMLFPIDWPEPFGLVMAESLACGTPVIAWNNGSVPEVIDDGVTGFVVESLEDAAAAVARIGKLDRGECRRAFETRFDVTRMAHDYVDVYRRLQPCQREIAQPVQAEFGAHPVPPEPALGVV